MIALALPPLSIPPGIVQIDNPQINCSMTPNGIEQLAMVGRDDMGDNNDFSYPYRALDRNGHCAYTRASRSGLRVTSQTVPNKANIA